MEKSSPSSPDGIPALVAQLPGIGEVDQTYTEAGRAGRLVVALSSAQAIAPGATAALVELVREHGFITEPQAFSVTTVLQEALVNAVVHGNCGLPGLEGFAGDHDAFTRAVETSLLDENVSQLKVVVRWRKTRMSTFLHVEDFGKGHNPDTLRTATLNHRSGRGTMIMRMFCKVLRYSLKGCRLSASFSHE